jgi:hypothetical protein
MALDEHTRVIAELLDDPTLAQQPTLRSAIVRLAELASVAEGKANAVQSLLAQQDRDTRTLRAALDALQPRPFASSRAGRPTRFTAPSKPAPPTSPARLASTPSRTFA